MKTVKAVALYILRIFIDPLLAIFHPAKKLFGELKALKHVSPRTVGFFIIAGVVIWYVLTMPEVPSFGYFIGNAVAWILAFKSLIHDLDKPTGD